MDCLCLQLLLKHVYAVWPVTMADKSKALWAFKKEEFAEIKAEHVRLTGNTAAAINV